MLEFNVNDAAALLGYLTLLVGFVALGSAGLAFIQSIPDRLRLRAQTCIINHDDDESRQGPCNGYPRPECPQLYPQEPVKFRVQRVRPQDFFYELGPDGHITDAVELNEDHTAVVAEYHERTQPEEYAAYDVALRAAADREGVIPHCDSNVLHAPGRCDYCDRGFADLQEFRLLHGINFTGESDPTKLPCPATAKRPVETIERWGGNVAKQNTDWSPEHEDDDELPVCD